MRIPKRWLAVFVPLAILMGACAADDGGSGEETVGDGDGDGAGDGDGDGTGDGDGDGDGGSEELPSFGDPTPLGDLAEDERGMYPTLIAADDGFAVAWFRAGGTVPQYQGEVHVTRLDATGSIEWDATVGAPFAAIGQKGLSWTGDGYGVAYERNSDEGGGIVFASIDAQGVAGSAVVVSDELTMGNSVSSVDLAWDGTNHGLAWSDGSASFALVGTDGHALTETLVVSDPSSPAHTDAVSTQWTGTSFALAWSEMDQSGRCFFRAVDAGGLAPVGDIKAISAIGDGNGPAMVWSGDGFGVAWTDYRLMGIPHPDTLFVALDGAGDPASADVQVSATGSDQLPEIGWDGSHYGVVWYNDDQIHNSPQLKMALMNTSGTMVADGVLFAAWTGAPSPSVAANDTGWALAWYDNVDGIDRVVVALEE